MYSCNDCGARFEELNEGACPQCGSADVFEEDAVEATEETATMEEVMAEADGKNKKGLGIALRNFGEDYIRYKNNMECAKECIKSLFEMAKEKGITKGMIIAYAQAITLEDFNAKVLCSAVQQELGIGEAEETAVEAEENNDADKEQSDNQDNDIGND